MAESLYLEMPKKNISPRRRLHRRAAVALVTVLLSAAGVLLWLESGYITSASATIEGVSETPADKFTEEYLQRPSGASSITARLKSAQKAEREVVLLLGQARKDEEARRALHEERVTEHVRAQLALRGFDARGRAGTVGKEQYDKAVREEQATRKRKDDAAAAFERASRMRAALDRELTRINNEQARGEESRSEGTARAYMPNFNTLPGDAVSSENFPSSVIAYFPVDYRHAIKPGQSCDIQRGKGKNLHGEVFEVLAPQAGPAGPHLPVRIRVDGATPGDPAFEPKFAPGEPVSARIRTRGFLNSLFK
ncbi:MAG: hypothetical protein LBB60_00230 [Desulfovibrio sp.]|jgi:membrane fusion protein (multidrug efflux system)|nr:hypothetical protein [Desulfovibrio sp.]